MKLTVFCGKDYRARYIKSVSEYCIEQLGLTNSRYTVIVSATQKRSKVFACTAHTKKDHVFVLLNLDKIPPSELGTTICHEFVHVKQIARGLLRHSPRTALWRGKRYEFDKVPFSQRPWEIQALREQAVLIRRYDDQLT